MALYAGSVTYKPYVIGQVTPLHRASVSYLQKEGGEVPVSSGLEGDVL